MFLLAGLLLVMGTVALGGVFVTMNVQEDEGTREQQVNLMEVVARHVSAFNESVRQSVAIGETDIDTFKDRVRELEDRVHVQAAKDGVYLNLDLELAPDPATWQRQSRCLSYDVDRSRDGVVIGYDDGTQRESIVGAVFDLHATDGRQVVQFPYYVKVYDCLPTTMTTWFTGIRVVDGFVLNPANAKSAADNNAVMTVGELPQGSLRIYDNLSMDPDSLAQNGWENERYIRYNDSSHAHHPATPLSDYLRFYMDMSGAPPDYPIENVRIRVDAWHVDRTDDYLQLRALHGGTVLATWAIPTQDRNQSTFYYDLPLSPSLNPYWTHAEMSALELEFQVIEVNKFDPPSFFMVEYVDVEYDYVAPEKYAFLATVDWPYIPEVYDRHFVELRYRFAESTPGEQFLLQIHSNSVWETRATLADTAGNWSVIRYQILASELESGILEMRLIDSVDDDRWTGDGDQIEFDYLYLWSEIDDAGP